jgi:hypothetical protein
MKEFIFNSPSWVFRSLQMAAIEPVKWPSLSSNALSSYPHGELLSLPYASTSFQVGLEDYVYFVPHESSDTLSHLGLTLLAACCAKGLYHRIAQSRSPSIHIHPTFSALLPELSAQHSDVQPSQFLIERPWCLHLHDGKISSCVSLIGARKLRLSGVYRMDISIQTTIYYGRG